MAVKHLGSLYCRIDKVAARAEAVPEIVVWMNGLVEAVIPTMRGVQDKHTYASKVGSSKAVWASGRVSAADGRALAMTQQRHDDMSHRDCHLYNTGAVYNWTAAPTCGKRMRAQLTDALCMQCSCAGCDTSHLYMSHTQSTPSDTHTHTP